MMGEYLDKWERIKNQFRSCEAKEIVFRRADLLLNLSRRHLNSKLKKELNRKGLTVFSKRFNVGTENLLESMIHQSIQFLKEIIEDEEINEHIFSNRYLLIMPGYSPLSIVLLVLLKSIIGQFPKILLLFLKQGRQFISDPFNLAEMDISSNNRLQNPVLDELRKKDLKERMHNIHQNWDNFQIQSIQGGIALNLTGLPFNEKISGAVQSWDLKVFSKRLRDFKPNINDTINLTIEVFEDLMKEREIGRKINSGSFVWFPPGYSPLSILFLIVLKAISGDFPKVSFLYRGAHRGAPTFLTTKPVNLHGIYKRLRSL